MPWLHPFWAFALPIAASVPLGWSMFRTLDRSEQETGKGLDAAAVFLLRLFGRREQMRFYARCCERIARLSARELGLPDDPPPPASRIETADTPDAGPLPERLTGA